MRSLSPVSGRGSVRETFGDVDRYFLALRLLIAAGGLIWLLYFPFGDAEHRAAAWALAAYLLFSALLYGAIFLSPRWIRQWYLAAVLADAGLVYVLVGHVGHNRGSYFIMFYLLIAISSFYFGSAIGIGIAASVSALYAQIYFTDSGPGLYPWPDFACRALFYLLTAVSMGFLSDREKRDRRVIHDLNEELTRKNLILEQAYRYLSLGRLSAGIAESINNPTSIMTGRIDLVLKEARESGLPEERIRDLEVIARNAHRVAAVARSLLALSRRPSYQLRPVDLNGILADTLVLMEAQFAARRITILRQLSDSIPLIRGDREGLQEVIVNLLSNAIDALPTGGRIQVMTKLDGSETGSVECVVSDNGAGIPHDRLERIFEPFYSTKGARGGVGLGLSTSLRIMKEHGGLIRVSSEPGRGSSFSMMFPIAGT